MLRLVLIGMSVAGLALATTIDSADARDGRAGAKRGKAVAHATQPRKRVVSYRTTTRRVAQGPELYDNTRYWHHNTPLDGKAMFDAISDLSSSGDD